MISSMLSTDRTARPELVSAAAELDPRSCGSRLDQISTENAAFVRAALSRHPAVRPEVVARARALAADPNYPPPQVLLHVARQILGSPDLSEDES